MREGDVHLGRHRLPLGLEPLEKPVQGLLVILAGDLRVARVDQLVVAELLERQEHVPMGLGLVGVLRGDLLAEPKRLLEMLAAGLRVAEGDAQVAELVAQPGAFAADLDLIGQGGRELVAQLDLFAIPCREPWPGRPVAGGRGRWHRGYWPRLASPRRWTARVPAIAGEGRGPGRRT